MAERRTGASPLLELGVGVIPSLLYHGPALVYLIVALIVETVPGVLRGGRVDGDWEALFLELLAPFALLALVSLTLLIVRGPEDIARRRGARLLVIGSGIPGMATAIWVLGLLAADLFRGPWPAAAGGSSWLGAAALFGSLFVGARYLRYLPLLLRGGPSGEAPIAPSTRR